MRVDCAILGPAYLSWLRLTISDVEMHRTIRFVFHLPSFFLSFHSLGSVQPNTLSYIEFFHFYSPNTHWQQITGSSAPISSVTFHKCPASQLHFALREILRNMKWLSSSGLLHSHAEHGVLLFWGEGELETAKERKSLLKVPLSPGSSIHSTSVKLLLRCWGSHSSFLYRDMYILMPWALSSVSQRSLLTSTCIVNETWVSGSGRSV